MCCASSSILIKVQHAPSYSATSLASEVSAHHRHIVKPYFKIDGLSDRLLACRLLWKDRDRLTACRTVYLMGVSLSLPGTLRPVPETTRNLNRQTIAHLPREHDDLAAMVPFMRDEIG